MRIFLFSFCLLVSETLLAQQKYTLSGYVRDAISGEALIGANVYIQETLTGTPTNLQGFYSITTTPGDYTLVASYAGYQPFKEKIHFGDTLNIRLNIKLKATTLQEVQISAQRNQNTESTQMGKVDLQMKTIEAIPAFLGEVDLLKSIQLLPGVSTAGEGNNGFYVRGGGPDQNLILLDNAVVYNASHLLGFFSVFNSDAIQHVTLIKGGMPANYGGRMASVLDITQKEGNKEQFHGTGGIGLISSRFTLEGPIKKDKASFIISGRRTYADLLIKPFVNDTSAAAGSGYYFYDLNGKLSWHFSDKDQLSWMVYYGNDVASFKNKDANFNADTQWGNLLSSIQWSHLFSDKLTLNTTAYLSRYRFTFGGSQQDFRITLHSNILDVGGKANFNYYPNVNHNVKFGVELIRHDFTPRSITANQGDTNFNTGNPDVYLGYEGGIYALDDFSVTDKLRINAGLRYSAYGQVGPFTRYTQNDAGVTIDTTYYSSNQFAAKYGGFEPRISLRYKLSSSQSIKASYNRNYQYVQLASLSPLSLPTDIWLPSTSHLKPQRAWQISAGYFQDFLNDKIETSVEVYYKDMKNLIAYRDNVQPGDGLATNEDNLLTIGQGTSYGLELFIKKKIGKYNGWIGYTLSKTERQFDQLNQGNWFPAKYDRRHDLSVVMIYDLNKKWSFGASFVYATGNAITLPVARYFIENQLVSLYTARNSYRMKPYHRLDISATLHTSPDKEVYDPVTKTTKTVHKKIQSSWVFSVYNVYDRHNPYFYYFDNTGSLAKGSFQVQAKQVSLFPILPSVTWNFKF